MFKRTTKRLASTAGISMLVALSVGLTGCSVPAESGASGGDTEAERFTIAFVPGISSDPFFKAMEIAALDEAEKLGVDLVYQGSSSDYSPQTQLPFVDAAFALDIDAIIIAPTDGDALQASVTKAEALGVPVITVDTTVTDQSSLLSHITGDNEDGGRQAAQTMADQIGGAGKVFVISGAPTITTDTQRVDGFVSEMETNFPKIQIVGVDYAYSQPSEATTKVNAALLNNPDLKGIFAAEGNSGVGAVASLRNSDQIGEIVLIGYDAYENQVEELEQGIYSALVAQDPAQEARLALQFAVAHLTGDFGAIKKEVVIPNVVMTTANMGETRKFVYAN